MKRIILCIFFYLFLINPVQAQNPLINFTYPTPNNSEQRNKDWGYILNRI